MIFAHASIIAEAVQGVRISYHPIFYTHLILLHVTLLVRILGNEFNVKFMRFWGGVGNVAAILIFMLLTSISVSGLLSTNQ